MNISENKPYRSLSEYLAGKAIHLKVPLSGTFELSPVCNFSCRMCYIRKTQKEVQDSPRGILTLNISLWNKSKTSLINLLQIITHIWD